MESDVNGVLGAAITVPAIVLICVFAVVSAAIMFRLYREKKSRYILCTYIIMNRLYREKKSRYILCTYIIMNRIILVFSYLANLLPCSKVVVQVFVKLMASQSLQ